MNLSLESLWRTYDTINEWIILADTKAAAILAAQAIVVGLVVGAMPEPPHTTCAHQQLVWVLPLVILTALVAAGASLWCIAPTLKVGEPQSMIFFAHVAKRYETPELYVETARQTWSSEEKASTELGSQIWANSLVASRKYWRITIATAGFAANLLLSVLAVLLSVL
jgi:hypothetical protein